MKLTNKLSFLLSKSVSQFSSAGASQLLFGVGNNYFQPDAENSTCAPWRIKKFPANDLQITSMACGFGYSLFLCAKKNNLSQKVLFGQGLNSNNQLSISNSLVPEPQQCESDFVSTDAFPVLLSAGRAHTVIVMKSNNENDSDWLMSCGLNSHGQCSQPIDQNTNKFNRVAFYPQHFQLNKKPFRIRQIECGLDHSVLVLEDGSVYTCGLGADGQTGLNHTKLCYEFTQVLGEIKEHKIVRVSSCGDTVLALSDNGMVFGWGNNEYGQLTILPSNENLMQIASPIRIDLGEILSSRRIVDIASGGSFCAVLDEIGEVHVWGYGSLGLGPNQCEVCSPTLINSAYWNNERIVELSCGLHHLCLKAETNCVYFIASPRSGLTNLAGVSHHQKNVWTYPMKLHLPFAVDKISSGADHFMILMKSMKS